MNIVNAEDTVDVTQTQRTSSGGTPTAQIIGDKVVENVGGDFNVYAETDPFA